MNERQPSVFVTVVAWLAILGSGFAVFTELLETAILFTMPDELFDHSGSDPIFRFVFGNFRALQIGQVIVWCVALACAIGMLRRREWGRKGIVLLLVLAVVMVAGFYGWQQWIMSATFGGAGDLATRGTFIGIRIAAGVMAAAIMVGMAWLAKRLSSQAIKAEFR